MIRDEVGNCLVYVSWNEILIRPGISPTFAHRPFSGASQRIYMSATFGMDGELESVRHSFDHTTASARTRGSGHGPAILRDAGSVSPSANRR